MHIDFRNWADILLIAPLSANTLAKLANGLCDDTLTCVARAWDYSKDNMKPIILAPAMNTAMWEHPITQQQLRTIQSFCNNDNRNNTDSTRGVILVSPESKQLACGDVGNGALASVDAIVETVQKAYNTIVDQK